MRKVSVEMKFYFKLAATGGKIDSRNIFRLTDRNCGCKVSTFHGQPLVLSGCSEHKSSFIGRA